MAPPSLLAPLSPLRADAVTAHFHGRPPPEPVPDEQLAQLPCFPYKAAKVRASLYTWALRLSLLTFSSGWPFPTQLQPHLPMPGLSMLTGLQAEEAGNSADDEDNSCSICLDPFEEGLQIMRLPCLHVFHRACIAPWLQQQGVVQACCPLCKTRCFNHEGQQSTNQTMQE